MDSLSGSSPAGDSSWPPSGSASGTVAHSRQERREQRRLSVGRVLAGQRGGGQARGCGNRCGGEWSRLCGQRDRPVQIRAHDHPRAADADHDIAGQAGRHHQPVGLEHDGDCLLRIVGRQRDVHRDVAAIGHGEDKSGRPVRPHHCRAGRQTDGRSLRHQQVDVDVGRGRPGLPGVHLHRHRMSTSREARRQAEGQDHLAGGVGEQR